MTRPTFHEPSDPVRADWLFVRRLGITLAIIAFAAAICVLADLLLLLFGAILFSMMLRAIADPFARFTHAPQALAILFALCVLAAIPVGAIMLLGPELSQQMRALFEQLPIAFGKLIDGLQLGSLIESIKDSTSVSGISRMIARVFAWSTTVLSILASVALVLSGGIYLAVDPALYKSGLLKLVPPSVQPNITATLDDSGEALRHWLGGQLIAMTLVGVLSAVGLSLAGVPSAFALGLIAGLADFVPIIGPVAAAVPTLLMASTQDWQTTAWALGVLILVQQIESNLIIPLVTGRSVSLSPAVGLFAVIAMGMLLGPLGLLFGFPLAVVANIAIRRLYVHDMLGKDVEILGRSAQE